MEGWFWRFTDTAYGRVALALCGFNRHPDGASATVAVAAHPDGDRPPCAVASILWRLVRRRPQRNDLAYCAHGTCIIVDHDDARPYELAGEDRDPTKRLEFSIEPGALIVHHASQPKETK